MSGAEKYGTREDFNKSKWKVVDCSDWEIDEQYMIDNPEGAEAYKRDIQKHGTRCIHCLWNDGDMCVHEKVEINRSAQIESEALDEFERGIKSNCLLEHRISFPRNFLFCVCGTKIVPSKC